MDSFSVWHWLVVLVAVAVAAWLIVLAVRSRRTSGGPPPVGIGGWLALLAFGLCVGLLRNLVEIAGGLPEFARGWEVNPAARGPMASILALSVAFVAVNLWTIVSLFRKKTIFRQAYLVLWIMAAVAPLSLFAMLAVPGVTLQMLLPEARIGQTIATLCTMGLWYWYIRVSERVRSTMVH